MKGTEGFLICFEKVLLGSLSLCGTCRGILTFSSLCYSQTLAFFLVLVCLVFCVGFLIWFYVEAKAFELLVEKGLLVLRFMEMSRGVPVWCILVRSSWHGCHLLWRRRS